MSFEPIFCAFGVESCALNAYGVEYFVVNAYGVEYFVLNAFGVECCTLNAFGVDNRCAYRSGRRKASGPTGKKQGRNAFAV